MQPVEAWETFRPWIETHNPRFAFNVARGLVAAAATPAADCEWAALVRQEARGRLAYLPPPGIILCLPTTPFPAPKVGLPMMLWSPSRERLSEQRALSC